MKVLELTKQIDASPEKVWNAITNKENYEEWTRASFDPTSTFIGDWSEGSEMKFVGSENGGMLTRVVKSEKNKTIEMISEGIIENGVVDKDSENAKQWTGAQENYYLTDLGNGVTEFRLHQQVNDEYFQEFSEMWAKALEMLKLIAERE
jgi:uncharacterized protein YndB with AHSA1/START domain